MANRKVADTSAPDRAEGDEGLEPVLEAGAENTAIATESATTTVEWPSEKKKPTPTGRLPSCMSLRVTLSMAAMWSASKAWRSPKL